MMLLDCMWSTPKHPPLSVIGRCNLVNSESVWLVFIHMCVSVHLVQVSVAHCAGMCKCVGVLVPALVLVSITCVSAAA